MARLLGTGPDKRLPTVKGRYYVQQSWAGPRVCAVPKHPKKPRSQEEADAREKFRQAVQAAKWLTAAEQKVSIEYQQGTVLMPRDISIAAMYGRLWGGIQTKDGVRYSMANRIDTSRALDALGQTPGSLLVRQNGFWLPIEPGAAGQVLRMDGAPPMPAWGAPPTSGYPVICRLSITTPATASATYPKIVVWDTSLVDDAGIWSAGTPSRMTIPAGVTRCRLSYSIGFTSSSTARSFSIYPTLNGSTSPLGDGLLRLRMGSTGSTANWFNAVTGIRPCTPGDYFEIRGDCDPTFSSQFLAASVVTIEVW